MVNESESGSRDPDIAPGHSRISTDATATWPQTAETATRGVTPRVVLLSVILAIVFGYITPILDEKWMHTYLGAAHLPPGAVGVLLLMLLVVNPLLRILSRVSPGSRLSFSRNELLTVYITCLFSALVPGCGAENYFVPNIIGAFYFATPENKWLDFLVPYLKPWLTPALQAVDGRTVYNPSAPNGWYVGSAQAIPWELWLVPIVAWSLLILASYVMLACLSVMLRAQWAEHEALTFPLLRVPLDMTEGEDSYRREWLSGFFRNRSMWMGFSISAFLQLMNGINLHVPDVPRLLLFLNYADYLVEAPWNQIGPVPILIYPVVIGITYLLNREVSFSLWFFYWFIKLQLLAAYFCGFTPNLLPAGIGARLGPQSFVLYQQVGCFLAYAALVLWTGREHFRHIFQRAFNFVHRRVPARAGEREEALSYPVAFWGFIACFVFVLCWSMAAGLSLLVALVLWLFYVMVAIALTRVVVEGGMLFVQAGWTPLGAVAQIFNSGPGTWLAPSSLVPGSLVQASLMSDFRACLMPSFVQSLKLAHDRHIETRPLLGLIATVTCVAYGMGIWMNVKLGYENAGLKLHPDFQNYSPRIMPNNVAALIDGARDVTWTNALWLMAGALITYGVTLARSHFLWFPLHPLGFLMCLAYPMHALWCSIFFGWLCKVLIIRFGGNEAYRNLLPFFMGLVVGDVFMMLLWNGIDSWLGYFGHQLMPG